MDKFGRGEDYQDIWDLSKVYGINYINNFKNRIEIRNDPELRDLIIRLLNNYYDIIEGKEGKLIKCNICSQEIPEVQFNYHILEHVKESKYGPRKGGESTK
jgi:hypothetical protein